MDGKTHFHEILSQHLHKLCSIHELSPMIMLTAWGLRASVNKSKGEFLEKNGEITKEDGDIKHYVIPLHHVGKMRAIEKKLRRTEAALESVPKTLLVAYVSQYDAFLGLLIVELIKICPQLINSSEKNISFSELQRFGSIDAAREHLIEKEVESVLRKSHSEQFSWLENKFNVPLRKDLKCWPVFIELTERRNLFVHCDGVVSSQYLKVCAEHKVQIPKDLEIGDKLFAPRDYLARAYECLYELSVKLTQVFWRKLSPDALEDADSSLIDITFELLSEKQYRLATELLDFAMCTLKKWGSESKRRILIINRAQSYYHRDKKDKCNEILDAEDWTACSDVFRICQLTLKEDYDKVFKLMKRAGSDGHIKENDYIEWPVFRGLRGDARFPVVFKEIFNRDPVEYSQFHSDEDDDEKITAQSDDEVEAYIA